jgi:hypothetical protein
MTGRISVIKKTIDSLDHIIILYKLEIYGLTGSFYNLIKSYFEHRYQTVQIGMKFSDTMVHFELGGTTNCYSKDQSLVL